MSARTDFHYSIDRAANAVLDAAGACRTASRARHLPPPHRAFVRRALRQLEDAQANLFEARNLTWDQPSPIAQLELL